MASLNKVMFIGNIGKDAELRYTAKGFATSSFSIAVNDRKKNDAGEWADVTEWVNVQLLGDSAEKLSQYLTKGKQIYVEGKLQTRTWDDDKGTKHYRTEVLAQSVVLLGSKQQDNTEGWND